jgi:hypothetical protein
MRKEEQHRHALTQLFTGDHRGKLLVRVGA